MEQLKTLQQILAECVKLEDYLNTRKDIKSSSNFFYIPELNIVINKGDIDVYKDMWNEGLKDIRPFQNMGSDAVLIEAVKSDNWKYLDAVDVYYKNYPQIESDELLKQLTK